MSLRAGKYLIQTYGQCCFSKSQRLLFPSTYILNDSVLSSPLLYILLLCVPKSQQVRQDDWRPNELFVILRVYHVNIVENESIRYTCDITYTCYEYTHARAYTFMPCAYTFYGSFQSFPVRSDRPRKKNQIATIITETLFHMISTVGTCAITTEFPLMTLITCNVFAIYLSARK